MPSVQKPLWKLPPVLWGLDIFPASSRPGIYFLQVLVDSRGQWLHQLGVWPFLLCDLLGAGIFPTCLTFHECAWLTFQPVLQESLRAGQHHVLQNQYLIMILESPFLLGPNFAGEAVGLQVSAVSRGLQQDSPEHCRFSLFLLQTELLPLGARGAQHSFHMWSPFSSFLYSGLHSHWQLRNNLQPYFLELHFTFKTMILKQRFNFKYQFNYQFYQ